MRIRVNLSDCASRDRCAMPGLCGKFARFLRKEFQWSRLWFNHWDWKAFTHAPWLPHTVKVQWIYLVYRAVVFFYFLVWLISIHINISSPNALIYFTQWSFISFNAYLLLSLLTTAINFVLVYVHPKRKSVTSSPDTDDDDYDDDDDDNARKCRCSSKEDQTTICDKLTWPLFLIGTESSFITVILFWTLIGNNTELSVAVNAHIHGLNGAVALLEVWITGIPIHLLHFIYILLFGSTYAVFTGVHYSVNGTGYDGERYIYPFLDYGSNPGFAIGTILICVLVVSPLVHTFFYLQYLLRHWLTTLLHRHIKLYHRYFKFHPTDLSAPLPVLYYNNSPYAL